MWQVEGVSYLDTSVKTDSSYEEQSASNENSEQVMKLLDFASVSNLPTSQADSEESEAKLGDKSDQRTYFVNNLVQTAHLDVYIVLFFLILAWYLVCSVYTTFYLLLTILFYW